MGLLINIIIIISTLIILLSLYFLFMKRRENEQMGGGNSEIDMEFGEEIGIDKQPDTENYLGEDGKFEKQSLEYDWRENELKYKYNKTLIRLISRDPNWLYAYWEVKESEFYQNKPVLRLFYENKNTYYDIEIDHESDNWYISHVKPEQKYRIAIGYMKNDNFHSLCESNSIYTPADRPSDNLDQKWMYIEELSEYQYRIEINSTISMMKSLKDRKEKEKSQISSPPFN